MIGSANRCVAPLAPDAIRPARKPGGYLGGCTRKAVEWVRCKSGVSAVEFALLAPVLGFSLIAAVDLGFGLTERMAIEHVLRAGAQSAMGDPGATTVLGVMDSAAKMNFTLADEAVVGGPEPLSLSAIRFCACPESVTFAVTCSTICSGSKPTFIYYRMSAVKTYRGWLIPPFSFARAAQVQIR